MGKIELGKKYRTADGHDVRIYAVDGNLPNSVHGAIGWLGGWEVDHWRDSGAHANPARDLEEVRPRTKREVWVNVYADCPDNDLVYSSKGYADRCAGSGRIACVKLTIDCEEGTGLED